MGRIPDVASKDKISSTLFNRLLADYLSQTDTEIQAIGGIVYIGRRTNDPSTVGWGDDEKGYIWFNTAEGKYKYWNGVAAVAFPAAGGAGAPVDASYVTINAEAGLSGEIQHANIVNDAHKHTPKAHTHVEADVTDLDHDAQKIKGVTVDDAAIAAGKYLGYDGANIVYSTVPGCQAFEGTGTGASPITVAHGLGAQPAKVFVTANAVQPYAVAYDADATNVYVYHNAAGSLTVSVRAAL